MEVLQGTVYSYHILRTLLLYNAVVRYKQFIAPASRRRPPRSRLCKNLRKTFVSVSARRTGGNRRLWRSVFRRRVAQHRPAVYAVIKRRPVGAFVFHTEVCCDRPINQLVSQRARRSMSMFLSVCMSACLCLTVCLPICLSVCCLCLYVCMLFYFCCGVMGTTNNCNEHKSILRSIYVRVHFRVWACR